MNIWCREHTNWTLRQWENVIRSDESPFTLFLTNGGVYVGRTPKEACQIDSLQHTVKHHGDSVMIWGAISHRSLVLFVGLNGSVTEEDYVSILADHFPVFPNK